MFQRKGFSLDDWQEVERLIRLDMSPSKRHSGLHWKADCRSVRTIYLHLYADKRRDGDLWRHLRCQKRAEAVRKRARAPGMIKNRVGIDERPGIVDQKSRIGDWEGDTIIGKNHRGALVTLAEEVALCLGSSSARQAGRP